MNVFSLENSSNCLSNKKFRTLSSISVVVPAYNEALSISKTYDKLIQVLEGTGVPLKFCLLTMVRLMILLKCYKRYQ